MDDKTVHTLESCANRLRTIQMLVRMQRVEQVAWEVLDHVIDDLDRITEAEGVI